MREYTTIAKVFSGGKVTVPKAIRDAMRLRDGDLVEITIRIVDEEPETRQGNYDAPCLV
jgi:AbrB family looped-hinge helix DNA binding protein